jgi:Zn-dependent oligopeptidase
MMQCNHCGKIFSSGIMMAPKSSATFINNKSQCPFCHSMENVPDGTFRATVEGFINVLSQTGDPLKQANKLFDALQQAKSSTDLSALKRPPTLSQFSKWLPDSPEKIAAYLAIVYTIIQFLTSSPNVRIEYQAFVTQYNQVNNVQVNR